MIAPTRLFAEGGNLSPQRLDQLGNRSHRQIVPILQELAYIRIALSQILEQGEKLWFGLLHQKFRQYVGSGFSRSPQKNALDVFVATSPSSSSSLSSASAALSSNRSRWSCSVTVEIARFLLHLFQIVEHHGNRMLADASIRAGAGSDERLLFTLDRGGISTRALHPRNLPSQRGAGQVVYLAVALVALPPR